jgi:L-threonylcarbamoyladenylate synthase
VAEVFNSLTEKTLVDFIKDGAVGVIPADTVYGLVASAENEKAVKRLYALKKREKKPGTVIAANISQLVDLGLKYRYVKAVEEYWPNAISVILPFSDPNKNYLRMGRPDLAVRIPKDKTLNMLTIKTGPLLTTSANQPDKPVAITITEAQKYFGDQVDFYVDGGDFKNREPSTIIRIIDDEVEVLREGTVKLDENGKIL